MAAGLPDRAVPRRLDRRWLSLPGASLLFSVLRRPSGVPPAGWSWLPLLVGAATASALRALMGLAVSLKWPNDVLAWAAGGDRKLAGILAEHADDAVVVVIGLNVSTAESELPSGQASSLRLAGAPAPAVDPHSAPGRDGAGNCFGMPARIGATQKAARYARHTCGCVRRSAGDGW